MPLDRRDPRSGQSGGSREVVKLLQVMAESIPLEALPGCLLDEGPDVSTCEFAGGRLGQVGDPKTPPPQTFLELERAEVGETCADDDAVGVEVSVEVPLRRWKHMDQVAARTQKMSQHAPDVRVLVDDDDRKSRGSGNMIFFFF